MPQTTALYEVTHSWYGSKPDTIRRGSDTDIAAALSIYWWPPVESTLIGMHYDDIIQSYNIAMTIFKAEGKRGVDWI